MDLVQGSVDARDVEVQDILQELAKMLLMHPLEKMIIGGAENAQEPPAEREAEPLGEREAEPPAESEAEPQTVPSSVTCVAR